MAKTDARASNPFSISNIYLILYNLASTVGWFIILTITVQTALEWKSNSDALVSKHLYKNIEFYLLIFQTTALLEVVHALLGLVRSNPMLVLFQVASRLLVVWAVIYPFPAPKSCAGVFIVSIAWAVTEVIRYTYYALNIVGVLPYFLTWCRYSFFIVLYPVGVLGELICVYKAVMYLEPLKIRNKYSMVMPNIFNFSFDAHYYLIFAMLLYIPIFPMLYKHMFSQREKILNGGDKKKKN